MKEEQEGEVSDVVEEDGEYLSASQSDRCVVFKGPGVLHWQMARVAIRSNLCTQVMFTPQPLRAVGVLFSPMLFGWAGG